MVLKTTPWDQGSELSSASMIPQMTVVADLMRSGDDLTLKPGYKPQRTPEKNTFLAQTKMRPR
jgi:hypothetical protein